jgi:PAS domain S-box-containing protein
MDAGTGTTVPHILILEDDTALQDLILRAFRKDSDQLRVSVAGTIHDARDIIGRDPPDLIIADWMLPDGKGIEILPRRDGVVTVPLVIMTGHGDERLAVEIMKSGAIDYVVKSTTVFRDLPNIARRALRDWDNIRERKRAEEAVRDSQKRLADILSFLPDAVLAIDNEGRVIAWNKAIDEMTGVAAADMLGKGDHEYSIPFYGERRPILIDLVLMEDTEIEKKYLFVHRDGEKIVSEAFMPAMYGGRGAYLWGTASPLYDTAGNRVGAIETIRNIMERKQAEQALQESEERYRSVVEDQTEFICRFTPDGRITFVNDAYCRYFSLDKSQCIAKSHSVMLSPEDARLMKRHLASLTLENPVAIIEHRIIMPLGEIRWQRWSDRAIFDKDGRLVEYQSVGRDTTEKKQAEEALRDSEMRYRSVIHSMQFGIVIIDAQTHTILEANHKSLEMIGGSNESVLGSVCHRFICPAELGRCPVTDLGQTVDSSERVLLTMRGEKIPILKSVIKTMLGGTEVLIESFIDITDRRLMESEIRSLNTALEQRIKDRTESLSKANEALEEENAQRQEAEKKLQASYDEKVMLLKEIHHRVKNNLQIIASLLNLQSRYIKDESTLAAIRESQNRVKAMALVHEKLYRAEDIAHISLQDYIRFLGTGLFQFYDAKSRGIQFTLEIHDVNVDIDAAIPLGLILNELISNSLKYAFPEGRKGEIAISVKKEDHTMTILFRDTGIGIPADLDWRNTRSLGLRLVNTLVDQMNGTVELDRSAGTLFTMVVHEKEQRGQ